MEDLTWTEAEALTPATAMLAGGDACGPAVFAADSGTREREYGGHGKKNELGTAGDCRASESEDGAPQANALCMWVVTLLRRDAGGRGGQLLNPENCGSRSTCGETKKTLRKRMANQKLNARSATLVHRRRNRHRKTQNVVAETLRNPHALGLPPGARASHVRRLVICGGALVHGQQSARRWAHTSLSIHKLRRAHVAGDTVKLPRQSIAEPHSRNLCGRHLHTGMFYIQRARFHSPHPAPGSERCISTPVRFWGSWQAWTRFREETQGDNL